ncbi:MAG: hypothetical protein RIT43_401 [Bacteroidota bacterium]|jgi:uncharacterized protein
MKHTELVLAIQSLVYEQFKSDSTGHDHYHIDRVFRMATHLQKEEGGNLEVIQLAALLHDISDHKLNGGKLNDGARVARNILTEYKADPKLTDQVCDIIDRVSFKGAKVEDDMPTLEGRIVQDADRLDAMGAIGIARAFAYGGRKERPLYDPGKNPEMHSSFEAYVKGESHTVNHFYEKLLILKLRLHTNTAKRIGEQRHMIMEEFLNEFMKEWNI